MREILSISLRPDLVTVLKQEAAREGLPVSALVAAWVQELDDEGADHGE
jgi:hypothetical protein